MPLPVPVLDNQTFDDLAAEAQALIPRMFPAWTDRNPSDPGITLLELFAFLAEAAFYQLDRVPARTLQNFAALTGTTGPPGMAVGTLLSQAVRAHQAINRAVTPADSEFVALSGVLAISPPLPQSLAAGTTVTALAALPGSVALAAPAAAGDVSLTLTDPSSLRVNDLLLIEGAGTLPASAPAPLASAGAPLASAGAQATGGQAEFATVTALSAATGTAVVSLGGPLAYPHAPGAPLTRMSQPADMASAALIQDAPAGADVLTVEPAAGLSSGWLRLDAATAPTYVLATTVARTKIVTGVIRSANVYPADLVTTVIVVPSDGGTPPDPLVQAMFGLMRERSPITTRIRVAAPSYCQVTVAATVVRAFPALLRKDTVQQQAQAALARFLDPVHGGEDGSGWEFGRAVYRSELYQVLQDTPGVDHVQQLLLNGNPSVEALPLSQDQAQASVSLARLTGAAVTVVDS